MIKWEPITRFSVLILITALFSLNSIIFAQEATAKGVYRLSGNIGLSYSTRRIEMLDEDMSHFQFNFSPGYSLFVVDNLEVGINVSYTYEYYHYSKFLPGWENSGYSQRISIGPAVRYYFPMDKIVPFVGAGIAFNSNTTWPLLKYIRLSSITLAGGFDYFVSKNVALEPSLIYDYHAYQDWSIGESQISLGVGINYFIY